MTRFFFYKITTLSEPSNFDRSKFSLAPYLPTALWWGCTGGNVHHNGGEIIFEEALLFHLNYRLKRSVKNAMAWISTFFNSDE